MGDRVYLEAGEPVRLLIWPYQKRKDLPKRRFPLPRIGVYAPRNVLIQRGDGSKVVRPFRGLRRADEFLTAPPCDVCADSPPTGFTCNSCGATNGDADV